MGVEQIFTGDLDQDWASLCALWTREDRVLGSEVGPRWETPSEHAACVEFAKRYPGSRDFLLARLDDPDPRLAAYAFKCLVRVTDLKPSDLPRATRERRDRITFLQHSTSSAQTLSEFFGGYFAQYSGRDELLDEQRRTQDWQDNELAKYKRASGADGPSIP